MDRYYFAYGSNMDVTQMEQRCPGSKCVGIGLLRNYRFSINTRGVATIIQDSTKHVYGVLWQITTLDEQTLDRKEGVCLSYYYKKVVEIEKSSKELMQALVYIATDSTSGIPRDGYMEKIVAAASHHRLRTEYVKELKTWLNPGQSS